MLRLDFSCEEGRSAKDLIVSLRELQKIFQLCLVKLKKDVLTRQTLQILGGNPRSLSLFICGDQKMREIQKEFRKLDRTTDILSFPTRELSGLEFFKERHLGDLVLSIPAVRRGARRGSRSFSEELVEVLIHGFLHLMGHDHVRSRMKARLMFELQGELYESVRKVITPDHERSRLNQRSTSPKSARTRRTVASARRTTR